jgi:hypothetical protein
MPIKPEMVMSGDEGKPYISCVKETKAAVAIDDIIKKIITENA